jgi:3D (Asp-Asp-Asp) domain-containing protein
MKSTALGSAVSVLLAFSAISYAKNYTQDPKPLQTATQVQGSNQQTRSRSVTPDAQTEAAIVGPSAPLETVVSSESKDDFEVAPETYMATAYSLRGRTASGKPVSRGLIAADTSVLPLGTRVRVDAGTFSGEYVVADTGGSVKGRRIDIWTPTSGEALRFGRRAVKLTVLSFGGKRPKSRSVRPRLVNPVPVPSSSTSQSK